MNDGIRNGATMHEVREFAGNSDIRATEFYSVRKEEDTEVAVRRVQIRLTRSTPRPAAEPTAGVEDLLIWPMPEASTDKAVYVRFTSQAGQVVRCDVRPAAGGVLLSEEDVGAAGPASARPGSVPRPWPSRPRPIMPILLRR